MANSRLNRLISMLAEDDGIKGFEGVGRYGIVAALAGDPPFHKRNPLMKPLIANGDGGTSSGSEDLHPGRRQTAVLASVTTLVLGVIVGVFLPVPRFSASESSVPEFPQVTHPSIETIYSANQSLTDSAVNSSLSPDGTLLAVGTKKGTVSLLDIADPQRSPTRLEDSGTITRTAFSPDGSLLAVGNSVGKITLWRVKESPGLRPEATLWMREDEEAGGAVADIAFSPKGNVLAVGSSTGIVRIWKTDDSKRPQVMAGPSLFDSVSRLAFSRDGRFLAAGGIDKTVQLWDMRAPGDPLVTSYNQISSTGDINALAFTTEDRLAVGSADGVVSIWDVTNPEEPRRISSSKPRGSTSDLTFDSLGQVLAASNANGTVLLWEDLADLENPIVLANERSHSGLSSVYFKGSQNVLAVGGSNGSVQLWSRGWE